MAGEAVVLAGREQTQGMDGQDGTGAAGAKIGCNVVWIKRWWVDRIGGWWCMHGCWW